MAHNANILFSFKTPDLNDDAKAKGIEAADVLA